MELSPGLSWAKRGKGRREKHVEGRPVQRSKVNGNRASGGWQENGKEREEFA